MGDIDSNFLEEQSKRPAKNMFYLAFAILKNNLFLVFKIFMTFVLLGIFVGVSSHLLTKNPLNAYDLESTIPLFLFLLSLFLVSSIISIGKTFAYSKSLDDFKARLGYLTLRQVLLKHLNIAFVHILSLILFFMLLGIMFYITSLNHYFWIPSTSLAILFMYAYVGIQEKVILANSFKESFLSVWNIFKPSFLQSLLNLKYFITVVFFIVFALIIRTIDTFYDFVHEEDIGYIIFHSTNLSIKIIFLLLISPLLSVMTQGKTSQKKENNIEGEIQLKISLLQKLFIGLAFLVIGGIVANSIWKSYQIKTYIEMGDSYNDIEEYDKAIISLHNALNIDSNNDEPYCSLGFAYTGKKEYMKALGYYRKYLKLNGGFSDNCYAYENIFELQLIQDLPFNPKEEEIYIKLSEDKKDEFMIYEMLKIMQSISKGGKPDIEAWKVKYNNVSSEWDFEELGLWIDTIKDSKIQQELQIALKTLQSHKIC